MKSIKEKVLEIVEIAKLCPENLQGLCFETLLNHYLTSFELALDKSKKEVPTGATLEATKKTNTASEVQGKEVSTKTVQEDIKDSDLHVKAKRFMEKEKVTIGELNNLFYKESDRFLPLFDDLKTTRMAESQIRITLLQSLVNALSTGEFEMQLEIVRAECIKRKCYDSANFVKNFRNTIELFDVTKIDRMTESLKLSDSGKRKLADLIKELQ